MSASPAGRLQPAGSTPRDLSAALNTISLTLLFASPLIILLPPRKLDFYTYSLATAWLLSANHIAAERTGVGIVGHLARKAGDMGVGGDALPRERASEAQRRLKGEREMRQEMGRVGAVERAGGRGQGVAMGADGRGERVGAEEESEARGVSGLARKLWMGEEGEGWKERRVKGEREALEEGKGYGGLIVDQIWEVWNWDKKGKDGDGGTVDKEGRDGER